MKYLKFLMMILNNQSGNFTPGGGDLEPTPGSGDLTPANLK